MKRTRKILALLLALSTLLAVLPAAGLAATNVKTLKLNTWYPTQQPGTGSQTVYKLRLTAESVVYVHWKNASGKSSFAEVDFCRDTACSNIVAGVEFYTPASGKNAVVLYPGTYYIAMLDLDSGSKIKITSIKASALSPSNTTSAKAVAINAGKPTEVIFDKKNRKPRWYKLRLSGKRTVRIYGNCAGLTLYNGKMKKIALRSSWDDKLAVEKWETKQKLAGGTYYIKISGELYSSDCGSFYSFFWR